MISASVIERGEKHGLDDRPLVTGVVVPPSVVCHIERGGLAVLDHRSNIDFTESIPKIVPVVASGGGDGPETVEVPQE